MTYLMLNNDQLWIYLERNVLPIGNFFLRIKAIFAGSDFG